MNPIHVDNTGVIFAIIWFLILISLIVLTVTFMTSAIQFFKHKTQTDRDILNKLDKLIELETKSREIE